MTANAPVVSIITVVYNDKKNIEATIVSVLQQTFESIEYIIVDGGSDDGTVEIIRKYDKEVSRWLSEPDNGVYDAMNKGIDLAKGEWINFMNSGDRFANKDVLKHLFGEKKFESDIIYGEAMVEYPNFQTLLRRTPIDTIWKGMCFCHQASFVKAALMKDWKFDLGYKLGSDYNFFYKAYVSKKKFEFVDQLVCNYNYREGLSKVSALKSLDERMKIVLNSNFSPKVWLYYRWTRIRILISLRVKWILGNKLTGWFTELLRA